MSFDTAIKKTLAHEGGYCNVVGDRGGETNYGITAAVARENGYLGRMCDMPLQVALDIYRKRYWQPLYEQLPEAIGSKTFDTAVNAGHARAHKLLQQACNACGSALLVDGVLGPKTVAAVNAADQAALLAAYRAAQRDFYLGLIARDPTQAKFKNGWLARAAS